MVIVSALFFDTGTIASRQQAGDLTDKEYLPLTVVIFSGCNVTPTITPSTGDGEQLTAMANKNPANK